MEDKRFDLTPRQILSHLLDIEKKAPRDEFRIFLPSAVVDSTNPDLLLVEEARKMMEFVGLYGYDLDVVYAKTAEGTGGDCQNNGTERTVHIHVSDSFRNNWKASVAILAHEICHKLLFVKGLYSPIDMMNEVYAELSTIYFGFGELILEGYQAKEHCLGYLKPDTYKKINLLVCVVCGNIRSEMLNLKDIDPLADEAIAVWEREDDKRSLLIDCFKNVEKQIAEYYRNICLLNQIQKQLKEDIKGEFERLDKMYFTDAINSRHTRLETFLFIYDNYCACDFHNNRISQLNETLNDSIYALFSKYQEQGNLELKYDFTCPVCGTSRENKINKKGISVQKCPNSKCGKYITFNTEDWNATIYQRKKAQKDKEYKAAYDRKEINTFRSEASAKIDEIRRNEQQRCKEDILKKIPSYLRWMVAKYIK